MDYTGDFQVGEQTFRYTIDHMIDYAGDTVTPDDMADRMKEADQVFYSVEAADGETYYRWVGGPFADMESLEQAITDETDHYESVAG